jgi:hypothetical protein
MCSIFCLLLRLLLSLGKQLEQRGMRAQKVILRGPFSMPPTRFAYSSAPRRRLLRLYDCECHRADERGTDKKLSPDGFHRSSLSLYEWYSLAS